MDDKNIFKKEILKCIVTKECCHRTINMLCEIKMIYEKEELIKMRFFMYLVDVSIKKHETDWKHKAVYDMKIT